MSDAQLLAELEARGYAFAERWHTGEVLLFVRREIARPAWPLRFVFWLLGLMLFATIAFAAVEIRAGAAWVADVIAPFGIGVLGIVVLIVPHELLHGLAFKMLGASQVVYGADWSKFVFHASAPGFPLDGRQMTLVALAPFIVITPALLTAGLALGGTYLWAALGASMMHTQGCLGDFAMLNFFARATPGSRYLTYDESGGESFVFAVSQARHSI